MIILLFLQVLSVYSLKSSEIYSSDLKSSESRYSKPSYGPEYQQISYYGLHPNQYDGSYEYPLEYKLQPQKHPKQYSSTHNLPKNPSYLTSDEEYEPKSYSSASYPASSYGYGVPTAKYVEQKTKYRHSEPESLPQYSKYKPIDSNIYRPYSTYYKKPIDYTYNEPNLNVYSDSPASTTEYKPYASKFRYQPQASHYPSSYEVYPNQYKPIYSSHSPHSPYKSKIDYNRNSDEDHNYSSNSYRRPLY